MGSTNLVLEQAKHIKMKFLLVLFLAGLVAVSAVPAAQEETSTDGGYPLVKDLIDLELLLNRDLSEAYFIKQLRQDDDSLLKFHYFRKTHSPLEAYLLTERFDRLANFEILIAALEKLESLF